MTQEINIEFIHIKRPYSFISPFGGAEFAALIYANDMTITPEEQIALSDELVAAGCRNAVCAGHDCSSWDDSIDIADLKRNDWQVDDDYYVMTSWHEDESLEDIVFFFLNHTSFADFSIERMVVLVIGGPRSTLEAIREEIRMQNA